MKRNTRLFFACLSYQLGGLRNAPGAGLSVFLRQLRQSEVQHFRFAAPGDEDVGRFDVVVDDPFVVRSRKRIRNLDGRPGICLLQALGKAI